MGKSRQTGFLVDALDDLPFIFKDIEAGTVQVYPLDPKAVYPYTIEAVSLEVDNGTMTGIAVKINGVAVTSMSSITADTSIDSTASTGAKTVAVGDRVTLETSVGFTGTPSSLVGTLTKKRIYNV